MMENKRLNELTELSIANKGLSDDDAVEVLCAFTHLRARWANALERFRSIGSLAPGDDVAELMEFRWLRDDCLDNQREPAE